MNSNSPQLIAITGGIGSGKSVVCRILETMSYQVYDCDSRAKMIMDSSDSIKGRIANEVSEDAIVASENGLIIDRRRLAEVVFNDSEKLKQLNSIVHNAVKADILRWHNLMAHKRRAPKVLFVETAILYESGLDRIVNQIWVVNAPIETRIKRAMRRDNAQREQIEARIKNQNTEFLCATSGNAAGVLLQKENVTPTIVEIVNDDSLPLLPQITSLLRCV